ncbi:hypothetical protein K438DRAFT_1763297 [Mycena galopus ATCC 62051]|nr:hypothetical protein K438DRAFT_1763297 [Mycena galopus ATCC 62051]
MAKVFWFKGRDNGGAERWKEDCPWAVSGVAVSVIFSTLLVKGSSSWACATGLEPWYAISTRLVGPHLTWDGPLSSDFRGASSNSQMGNQIQRNLFLPVVPKN